MPADKKAGHSQFITFGYVFGDLLDFYIYKSTEKYATQIRSAQLYIILYVV